MRFKLTLELLGKATSLPLNYQYELSSWLYKTLLFGDPEFADFLHSRGYVGEGRHFKLFSFSPLSFIQDGPSRPYHIQGDRLFIQTHIIELELRFCLSEQVEPLIQGLFQKRQLRLGDFKSQVNFQVLSVEALPLPNFSSGEVKFAAESAVCISHVKPPMTTASYLHPLEDGDLFEQLFFNNLRRKQEARSAQLATATGAAANGDFAAGKLMVLNQPRSKLITIRAGKPDQTKVRGYVFHGQLQASPELLETAYLAGLGEKNSQGFGFWEVAG